MTPRAPRCARLRLLAATLTCGALLAGGAVARADPDDGDVGGAGGVPSQQQVDEAKAGVALATRKVQDLQGALDAADARLAELTKRAGIAAERANAARVELQQRALAAAKADAAARAAAGTARKAQADVDALAAQAWMAGGSLDGLEVLLTADGAEAVHDRAAALDLLTSYRSTVVSDADRAADRAAETRRAAALARAQQEAAAQRAADTVARAQAEVAVASAGRAQVQQRRTALLAELAAVQHTSITLETRRREALAAAAAKRAAEQAAREDAARQAEAGAGGQGPGAPAPGPPAGPVPVPHGSAAVALAYARAQLGKAYVWGGEGPLGYDCSGLTKMAWARAGVALTHQTNWQWAETAHVPLAEARPGDLIFYGQIGGDIYHVGLYLGGGAMIHAPTFGEPVKISSIFWGELVPYAGRVR